MIKNSEYDQEIPQSQTADKPMVLQGITRHQEGKLSKASSSLSLSLPHQDDCKSRAQFTHLTGYEHLLAMLCDRNHLFQSFSQTDV